MFTDYQIELSILLAAGAATGQFNETGLHRSLLVWVLFCERWLDLDLSLDIWLCIPILMQGGFNPFSGYIRHSVACSGSCVCFLVIFDSIGFSYITCQVDLAVSGSQK